MSRRRSPAPAPQPAEPTGNPLCVGLHCEVCGTRLEIRNGEPKPCPLGPHEEPAA